MRLKIGVWGLCGLWLCLLGLSHAQNVLPGFPPGTFTNRSALDASSGFTPSCTQSTNFIARTSGLSNGQKTNYDNLLCGLETDGIGCSNTLDALYVVGAPDSTTQLLNLCSTNFSLVSHGTVTFAADAGATGNGSTGYYDTQLATSGATFCTQSDCSFGVYIRTSRTTNANTFIFGTDSSGTNYLYLRPLNGGNADYGINDGAFLSTANSNAQGMWVGSRTGAATTTLRRNQSAFTTSVGVSTAVSTQPIVLMAVNDTGAVTGFSTDQVFAFFIGKGLSVTTGMDNAAARINTYATVVGANVY